MNSGPSISHQTQCPYLQSTVSASSVMSGLKEPAAGVLTQTYSTGEVRLNCVLACPLLEIPVIVFQADVDALGEVARIRDGPQEVGLHQGDVVQLRGAGCASLSAIWV